MEALRFTDLELSISPNANKRETLKQTWVFFVEDEADPDSKSTNL